jgi:fructose-1,6-bisphosphatase/sedoheptulose 1,7-bisphosphatase-like protein
MLAVAERGNLLNAPDVYMEKLAVGPGYLMTTESVVMRASSGTVRWVKGEHRKV